LSILLTTDADIHELNRAFRGKDRPTDVLSFSQWEGEPPQADQALLGDIAISLETASRQARTRGHSLEHELQHLLVHGVLHLLGHDHVKAPKAARRMRKEERRLHGLLNEKRNARTRRKR